MASEKIATEPVIKYAYHFIPSIHKPMPSDKFIARISFLERVLEVDDDVMVL